MTLTAAEAYEILTRAGTFKAAAGVFRALAVAERDAGKTGTYGDRNANQVKLRFSELRK